MSISIKNRKAYFEYSIIDTYTAGISLQGSEIKSIRNSNVNLAGSFCSFIDKELFVKNLYIYSEEDKEGNDTAKKSQEEKDLGELEDNGEYDNIDHANYEKLCQMPIDFNFQDD